MTLDAHKPLREQLKPASQSGPRKPVAFELNDLAFPISLTQTRDDLFTVRYGVQVKTGLNYATAARELGECILHALACDSKINNGGR